MGRTVLISIFYIFSYLTFSPAGIYALLKRRFKNKILWNITFGIFLLKLIFDFFIYKDVLLTDKAGFILTAFILVFNCLLYILAFRNIPIKSKKQSSNKEKALAEIDKRAKEFQKTRNLYAHNKSKINSYDIEGYINTGEIYTFNYKGNRDILFKTRNIIVRDIYEKNGYTYVNGFDIDINQNRTFRVDRMA